MSSIEYVLIVDDEPEVRQLMSRRIKRMGFTAYEAENGQDALAKLKQYPEIQLVLCDLQMPKLGGEDLIKEIKTLYADKKIVVITGNINPNEEDQIRTQLGADAVLAKPVFLDTLVETIQRVTA